MSFIYGINTLWIDMDGVLANFDKRFEEVFGHPPMRDKKKGLVTQPEYDDTDMWNKFDAEHDFFYNLEPMPDFELLWKFAQPYNPKILTGTPRAGKPDGSLQHAPEQKKRWIAKHLGPDIEVIATKSAKKCEHCQPGDILVDDWERHMNKWIKAGGIWITHTSAENSINELKKYLT